MTLQKDVLHGGISKLWQNDGMVYKDFALVTGYGYGVFLYTWCKIYWCPTVQTTKYGNRQYE